jgi:hypothetical protein
MIYRLLADLVVALHLAFVVFVMLGGLLALRWPRASWVHVPAAAWGVTIELGGWVCPLTPLENALRRAAGEAGYAGGFVERYLLPVVYPGGLTREVQLVLAAAVVGVNVVVYALAWQHRARSRGRP